MDLRTLRIPLLALALPLLCACGPDGTCAGAVGAVALEEAELGGDTQLVIRDGSGGREAVLRLDAGQLVTTLELTLPAERGARTLRLVGPEEPFVSGQGAFRRVRVAEPADAPAVAGAEVTVKQEGTAGLSGALTLDFADASRATCSFDVDGQSTSYADGVY